LDIGWPTDLSWYKLLTDWGSVIGGSLALAAGAGTVWATIKSANREIAAAQEQTKVAQRQTAVTREIERRRIAREGYSFYAMLEAAMGAVIEDAGAARNLPPPSPTSRNHPYSSQAGAVRQRVKRAGLTELRNAFLRFGGPLTAPFLQLDKEIEDFAEQRVTPFNSATGFPLPPQGVNAGLWEQLDRIEQQASALREKAAGGMKLCRDELAKELVNLEP
jgi:hypothetical protein